MGGMDLNGDEILRDVWLFNTKEEEWTRIDPTNDLLRRYCESSLCLYGNKIFIVGGLV